MNKVTSGISGLDEMLGGGYPQGKIMIVFGGPGTGKTIMSTQYLVKSMENGDPAVFVTLEEPINNIIDNVKTFGWDLQGYQEKGLLKTVDLYMVPHSDRFIEPVNRSRGESKLSVETEIISAVEEVNAKHLVLDPFTSILIHEPRAGRKRHLISQIFGTIRSLNITTLITSEGVPREGDFYMEEFLADGVILLSKNIKDYKLTKTLRLDKMRGMDFDDQPRRYAVTQRGFQVFHAEPVLI
jgi:KaiC/GvpD/RAD55 family RecA-like ATPase